LKDWISKHVKECLEEDKDNNPWFYPLVFIEIKGGIVQDVKCNMSDAVIIVKDFDVKLGNTSLVIDGEEENEYIYSWPETQL